MTMDEILHDNALEPKDNESDNLETANFESELLNCVKEVVENISMKENEVEDSNERNFLNSIDDENNSPFQIKEKPSSDISALFEMAAKNSSAEFEPFNPFDRFASVKEPCENGVISPLGETDISFNANDSFKTAVTSKKPRKKPRKRRKWIIKKRIKKNEVATKQSLVRTENCGSDYARLYEICLNYCHHFNEEVPSMSMSSPDGYPLPENELIVLMAKDLINKIDQDSTKLINEKKSLKEKQVILLKKLVELLNEKSCSLTNGEAKFKKNLALKHDGSGSKFDFCGFENNNPQTRNSDEEITLEKLFLQSPPPSPTHFFKEDEGFHDSRYVSVPVSPNSIMDLNFVFKPLFNPFPVSESVSSCSETKGKKGKNNSDSKNQLNVRSVNLIRKNKSQNFNSKVIVKKVKNNSKVSLKRLKKSNKAKNSKLNVVNNRQNKVKTVRNTLLSNTSSSINKNSNALVSSNTNEGSQKTFQGFSKGSFGAPQKSSLLNLRNILRTLPEISKGNQKNRRSVVSVKRKLDHMSGNNSILPPKSKFTVNFSPNLRSKSRTIQPPDKENKNKYLQVALNKAKLDPADAFSKVTEKGEPKASGISTKEPKTPVESSKSPILYYPVHPFVSHDLPVHFIPVDSSRIPPFFPLYTPVINSKNSSPIYPSFIRTIPNPKIKTPTDYVLSKGIKTKSIPIRSFSEEKVKENILPSIPSSKCPLIPEIPSEKSRDMNIPQSSLPNKNEPASFATSLTKDKSANISQNSNIVNTSSHLPSQTKPNQKVHRCQKCGFTTPKLGVLKRHELSHSQGQIPQNNGIIRPELGISPSQKQVAETNGDIANFLFKNNFIQQHSPKKSSISSSPKRSPNQKKTASRINTEKKTKIVNEQKNVSRVNNERKISVINDEKLNLKVNNVQKASIVDNQKSAPRITIKKNSSLVSNKNSNSAPKLDRNNLKFEGQKHKENLSSSDDSNSSFTGFKDNSVREKFMKRFPGVTITPLFSAVES